MAFSIAPGVAYLEAIVLLLPLIPVIFGVDQRLGARTWEGGISPRVAQLRSTRETCHDAWWRRELGQQVRYCLMPGGRSRIGCQLRRLQNREQGRRVLDPDPLEYAALVAGRRRLLYHLQELVRAQTLTGIGSWRNDQLGTRSPPHPIARRKPRRPP